MPKDFSTKPRNKQAGDAMILSASPEKALKEVIATIEDLRSLYIAENLALEAADTNAFMGLQDKKLETAKLYQSGIEQIMARKDEMKRVDPALKRKLTRMQEDFHDITSKNKTSIKRMQRTMDRLSNTIRNAAKDAVNRQQATSYGECGRLHMTDKRMVSTGITETA